MPTDHRRIRTGRAVAGSCLSRCRRPDRPGRKAGRIASTWQTRLATFRPHFEKFAESEPNIHLRVVKLPKDHPDGEVVMRTLVESTLAAKLGAMVRRFWGAPNGEGDSGRPTVAPCYLFAAVDRAELEKGFLVGESSLVEHFELLASQAGACLPPGAIREGGINRFSAPVTRHRAWLRHYAWVVFLFQQLDECPGSLVRRGWLDNALCPNSAKILELEFPPEARAQAMSGDGWIRQYETVALEVNPFRASVFAIDLALGEPDQSEPGEHKDETDCDAKLTPKLRPSDEHARNQYNFALKEDAGLKTDREAYDWLSECKSIDQLPSFASWSRSLRRARKAYGEEKNTSKIGKPTKSVVLKSRI